ncbi:MAG TPA: PEP-CTERM sorting domain-containing protein, partial [Lacipirellulaceae bacterium]|nr:PEP-CTERM sorting domain-containing protein [Lacipirellulaceae bacterium]
PQAHQDISIISTTHDAANDLTTIVLERPNNTGDGNDAIFSPSMMELDVIGAYDSFSSRSAPNGNLSYHGSNGRGFGTITFSPIPEPNTVLLLLASGALAMIRFRR